MFANRIVMMKIFPVLGETIFLENDFNMMFHDSRSVEFHSTIAPSSIVCFPNMDGDDISNISTP